MKRNKIRLRTDFRYARTTKLHKEGLAAYNFLAAQFSGSYKQLKWLLTNISLQHLAKTVKEKGYKAGDDLEGELGL